MLQVNGLFCDIEDTVEKPRLFRVLWFSLPNNIVVCIEMNIDKGMPIIDELSAVQRKFDQRRYQPIKNDPWDKLRQPDSAFTPAQLAYRDKAWACIKPLIDLPPEVQFTRSGRAKAMKTMDAPKNTKYRWIRSYYQRGQMPNALLSDHDNSGGRGKPRTYTRKTGRWSALEIADGRRYGIPLSEELIKKVIDGIERFYVHSKHNTLRQAYNRTLETYFNDGYRYEDDGTCVPDLLSSDKLPTYAQFEYLRYQHFNPKTVFRGKNGNKAYLLRGRAITSDATQQTLAPGSIYEIDATVGDIYLRSSINKKNIAGRCTVYMVVDVFSRMIVGYYIGYLNASWESGTLALAHAICDKVDHCAQYGVEITTDEWPTVGLPTGIVADNGEFASYHADNITSALRIELMNTPPYRGDLKPIVERGFRRLNDVLLSRLPGFVMKRERGDKDYRLSAKLNIKHLHYQVIQYILDHNRNHLMKHYPLSQAMIEDGVKPYPIELWRWGMNRYGGSLRPISDDIVRLNLLHRAEATVTAKGIRYKGLFFDSDHARKHAWYESARINKRRSIDILVDPNNTNVIYRVTDDLKPERCELIDNSHNEPYQDAHWYEVEVQQTENEVVLQREQSNVNNAKAAHNARIERGVDEAIDREYEREWNKQTKSGRLSNIKENRSEEKVQERLQRHGNHAPDMESDPPEIVEPEPINENESNGYIGLPDHTDFIDDLLDEE